MRRTQLVARGARNRSTRRSVPRLAKIVNIANSEHITHAPLTTHAQYLIRSYAPGPGKSSGIVGSVFGERTHCCAMVIAGDDGCLLSMR